jgi:prepilin-type N-terminal cleavage/methylation domain-containing protein
MAYGKLMNMKRVGTSGFTIVELLIVVVVIAILAAITIVSYNGITNRSKDSAAALAAKQAGTKIQTYAVQNSDTFPDVATMASTLGMTVSSDNSTPYQYSVSADGKSYCLTVTTNAISYFISNTTGNTKGACAGHGSNGVAPIANFIPNPKMSLGITGWAFQTSGSVGSTNRVATGGPNAQIPSFMRRDTTSAPTSSPMNLVSNGSGTGAFPVTAGKTYAVSAYARSSCVLGAGVRLDLVPYDASGVAQSTYSGSVNPNTANTWLRATQVRTMGAGISYVRIQLAFSGPTSCPAVSTYDATGFMLSEASDVPNFADGDTTNWAWSDSANPNNSTSSGPATY